jgi:hypothetical protein
MILQATGQVESLETAESGDIIVAFKSRAAAEQVRNLPSKGRGMNSLLSSYLGDVEREQRTDGWLSPDHLVHWQTTQHESRV